MTQSLTALFSPETSPLPTDLQPFRLLCDALFFYALPGKAEQQELWTGYTPVHLSGEDQARFQSLAHELKGHEAEFHGGLLASLSAGHGDRDEASAGSLASRLRSGANPDDPQKTADGALWRAMLILKLAEMYREEEREITQGFTAVSGKEAEIFAAIRGGETEEEEGDEEEIQTLQEFAAATTLRGPTLNLTRLAKAWGHLYTRDTKAAKIPLLVTTNEELQVLLAEAYETLTGRLPRQLTSLALPTQTESAEYGALVEKFEASAGTSREHFNRLLIEIAASGTISAELLAELHGAGNDLNRAALPFQKGSSNEKAMHFYAYEGTSLIDLFASLTGTPIAEPQKASTATGLLAVLS
ncbi:MAG: hypothetical protein WC256_01795 [Desulfurivibrionaceae bacterium]|jgi:hypothetical protein